jgi:hypothetical protein
MRIRKIHAAGLAAVFAAGFAPHAGVRADAFVEGIVIDTDAFTVTGDGDDDPGAFKGLHLVTLDRGSLAGFYVLGDLTIADG